MAMDIDLIWARGEADYFSGEDWTGQITLMAFRKLVFARRAFWTKILCGEADRSTFSASSGKSGNIRDNISTFRPRERREPYLWLSLISGELLTA
jgi:hypothetical protein